MKYTFAAYVKAVNPRMTYQLVYATAKTPDEAKVEILAHFDKYFPECVDRFIDRFMTIEEYAKEQDRIDTLNYALNN